MDTKGDLKKAIKLFSDLLKQYPQEKELAARAQLHIGLCYEKLGQNSLKMAQDAFQRVVDNYPTQSEEVRVAKKRLARILLEQGAKLPLRPQINAQSRWPRRPLAQAEDFLGCGRETCIKTQTPNYTATIIQLYSFLW